MAVGFVAPALFGRQGPGALRCVSETLGLRFGQPPAARRRHRPVMTAAKSSNSGESIGDDSVDAMRARLEGLFGDVAEAQEVGTGEFDGNALRQVMRDRFTVEYDMHPVVRNDRVFIHILWRYYEQVSFPLEEEEWAEHCEAVADLLKKWGAVDWFCDYITSCKKRPVVGISLHVPIPDIARGHPLFPTSERFE